MIVVGAIHRQHFDSATLAATARAQCAVPLRRAGAMTELVVSGVHACLDGGPDLPTALIWGSRIGIRQATARVVTDLCVAGEAAMPFDFLATQPTLAAVPVQQTFPCVANALYQPWQADTDLHWARMLQLAMVWLHHGRHARVLCGQVEPGERESRGDWLVLARQDAGLPARARVDGAPDGRHDGSVAMLMDWLAASGTAEFSFAPAADLPALRFERAPSSTPSPPQPSP